MQSPVFVSQALLEHSESAAHARQDDVSESHTGDEGLHCDEVVHSTQTFVVVQCGAVVGQSESIVHAGAASDGGAVLHSWLMQTNPSVHGRLVSIAPRELQSAGDVQQTTGFGFVHATSNNATAPKNRIP